MKQRAESIGKSKTKVQLFWASTDRPRFFEDFLIIQDLESYKFYFVDGTSNLLTWYIPALKNRMFFRAYEVEPGNMYQYIILHDEKWTEREVMEIRKSHAQNNSLGIGAILVLGGIIAKGVSSFVSTLPPIAQSINSIRLALFLSVVICTLLTIFGVWLAKKILVCLAMQKFKLSRQRSLKVKGEIFGVTKDTYAKYIWMLIFLLPMIFMSKADLTSQTFSAVLLLGFLMVPVTYICEKFSDWRGPTFAQKIKYGKLPIKTITRK